MKRSAFEPLIWAMGALLAERIAQQQPARPSELVVSVPMHWSRRLRRGVHPARILAAAIARQSGLSVANRLLVCRRKTKKQGTLSPTQRLQNVRNAFQVSPGYAISDASLLLVDDIMTTGATLSEAARALRKAGARSVRVAVVARGVGH